MNLILNVKRMKMFNQKLQELGIRKLIVTKKFAVTVTAGMIHLMTIRCKNLKK